MEKKRDILATIALPYANGPIHLGHLVEAIQADIWVRQHKLAGHTCWYVCGNDAHGTAVMLSAQKHGVSPEQWVQDIHQQHACDYAAFGVGFDHFYTTHSEENRVLSESIYQKLKERGDIVKRTITQAFDEQEQLFLADRYVRGGCPKCGALDQYGDNCEACGASYSPSDLKNPISVLSGKPPSEKASEHCFFRLDNYHDMLVQWIDAGHVHTPVANKLKEWFGEALRDWDISRDAPYFGFEIPDEKDKYFYVWLDAPMGYIASTQNLATHNVAMDADRYWAADSSAELHHFIGKDIVYFHALFWPAILFGSGYRLPTKIHVHGYLTINGEKMSKSRGTFITAEHYANHLNPEHLRYYYAAKLNADVQDIDLNLQDFMARVNSDLVGKFVNLASRCSGFITKRFNGQLAAALPEPELYEQFVAQAERVSELYDSLDSNRCMREVMALADRANQYIDQHKPWALAKQEGMEDQVQAVCTQGLNLFKVIATFLAPVLPSTAKKVEAFLNTALTWDNLNQPLLSHTINRFKPLMQRITDEDLAKIS